MTTATTHISSKDFSPNNFDMMLNQAPFVFPFVNPAGAGIYNFFIKVDFFVGTQLLQIGGIDQMQLEITDPCPGAVTVSVPD